MSELNKPQNLADWQDDVESLIREMKRRAGVSTDADLAAFLEVTAGAVANWKRRGAVPQSALLIFEKHFAEFFDRPNQRALFARALAMRLAQRDVEKNPTGSDPSIYMRHAGQLDIIADECFDALASVESERGDGVIDAYFQLFHDEGFYDQLSAWAKELTIYQLLERPKLEMSSMARRFSNNKFNFQPLRQKR